MLRTIFLITTLLVSTISFAQVHQTTTFKVASLRFEDGGLKVRFNPAPTACQGGDKYRMHAEVVHGTAGAEAKISMLLAAYISGTTFRTLWFSGEGTACSNSHILTLDGAELTER